MNYSFEVFAQVYGGGTYNCSAYQSSTDGSCTSSTTSTTSTGAAASSNGSLSNTGFDVLVVATIACAITFAALLIRFWKRPSKKLDS